MRAPLVLAWMLIFTTTFAAGKYSLMSSEYPTKSGLRSWVDPDTPVNRKTYTTSRGRQWELIMSDEFNVADRSFRPGDDHMWTSIEKPDGVNGALEIYSHNMTSTKCDDDGNCYFYIEVASDNTTFSVYNMYKHPPGYQNTTFYYRAAMVQSWNKFCYQGGMLEVRAQLPGAVSAASGNPDLARGNNEQVTDTSYYPSWPGIWMMGNLGRAIFSASTNRMWPFSYDRCEPDIFDPSNQRISACDNDPGYGLNTNQGRGAPEIDLLEGGGLAISSSLQIAPGMPSEFRLFPPDPDGIDATNPYCVYAYDCKTEGANLIDVPTAYYKQKRGHKSWYQSLRYSSNNRCAKKSANVQSFATVDASVRRGITENSCTTTTCPASLDLNGNMDLIDGTGRNHWGINSNGTCFPVMNSYMGAYLCDPDSTDARCASPRPTTTEKSNAMDPFNYQMDAISSNWPVHLGVYTDFIVYQLEWVTGGKGYVRWMLDGSPLFEVAADTVSNVPQNGNSSNPQKLMLEEPMSVIFNVALSSSWGATPPNAGNACRGDGSDKKVNKICNEFPMFMKIDYIRLYQDQGDDLDTDNYMQVGCDPASHPTKQWIQGHINEYQDNDNPVMEVIGKAFCKTNSDCTVGGNYAQTGLVTGLCVESRCSCLHPKSWNGPRCTIAQSESKASTRVYGPSIMLAVGVAAIVAFVLFVLMWNGCRSTAKKNQALIKARTMFKTNSDARVANAASISNV